MKKLNLFFVKGIICVVIVVGFMATAYITNNRQSEYHFQNIESISKLTSLNLYSEISNTFSEPVHVSQTMSKDTFLVEWLAEETARTDADNIAQITEYLKAYQLKNKYSTAFLISDKTRVYYYNDGVNKVIGQGDAHDVWYNDFVESGLPYRLEIDYDQTNADHITLFVNCRVEDSQSRLLGVVGVGLQIDRVQELLAKYEKGYALRAFLVDQDGNIMIQAAGEKLHSGNLFNTIADKSAVRNIVENKTSSELQWYDAQNASNCMITRYIKDFDWYLVVEKDNSDAKEIFYAQIRENALIIAIIIVIVLMVVSHIIQKYNHLVVKMADTDSLTSLPNREAFYRDFEKNRLKPPYQGGVFFMFDIDNFKQINDGYGHQFGNEVLEYVGKTAAQHLDGIGTVARWGGDEFVGVVSKEIDVQSMFSQLMEQLSREDNVIGCAVGISVGVTLMNGNEPIKAVIERADQALYEAKKAGKGRVSRYEG